MQSAAHVLIARAAWLEDYPHIAINSSGQVVIMHFTKKVPEWHSEIVANPRPLLWVEQKHMILEQILLLPYMTIEPSFQFSRLTILYWVVCTIMLDAVMQYYNYDDGVDPSVTLSNDGKVLQAQSSDGILCNLTVLQYWHHAFMEQVHLMEWPSTQVFCWTSPSVAMISWGSDHVNCMCNVEIEDQEHFYYTALDSSYSLGWNIPTQSWFYLLDSACCQTSIPTAPRGTHVYDCKGVRKLYTYTGLPFYTADIGNFLLFFTFLMSWLSAHHFVHHFIVWLIIVTRRMQCILGLVGLEINFSIKTKHPAL